MTNTIIGMLFLLIAVAIISLYGCNRNNSKSDTTKQTAISDSTTTFNKMDSTANKTDTIAIAKVDSILNNTDTLAANNPDFKQANTTDNLKTDAIVPGEKLITDEVETSKTTLSETTSTAQKTATKAEIETEKLSLKENTKKPTATTGGGLKATNAVKDRNKDDGKRILILGTGGGVTGAVTEYRIEPDGVVYEKNSITGSPNRKKALKVEQFSSAVQKFEALNIDALKLNDPGNIYYYIGYEQNGTIKKVTWGNVNETVPETLKSYYEFMMAELSK